MIGQHYLAQYNFPQRPHLLVGEWGSGKHLLVEEFAQRQGLEVQWLDSETSQVSFLKALDLSGMSFRDQLKWLPEVETAEGWLFLLAEQLDQVEPHLRGRCLVWEMEPYTAEELRRIRDLELSESFLTEIIRTPGQLLALPSRDSFLDLLKYCHSVVERMGVANFANALVVANRIDCDGEGTKFNVELFLNGLLYELCHQTPPSPHFKNLYRLVLQYKQRSYNHLLNIHHLMESMLIDYWQEVHQAGGH